MTKQKHMRGLSDDNLASILDNHRATLLGLIQYMTRDARERFLWLIWLVVATGAVMYLGVR